MTTGRQHSVEFPPGQRGCRQFRSTKLNENQNEAKYTALSPTKRRRANWITSFPLGRNSMCISCRTRLATHFNAWPVMCNGCLQWGLAARRQWLNDSIRFAAGAMSGRVCDRDSTVTVFPVDGSRHPTGPSFPSWTRAASTVISPACMCRMNGKSWTTVHGELWRAF